MIKSTMSRVAVVAAALLVTASPGVALAHSGPPTEVSTTVVRDSAVVPFIGPCGGGGGMVSIEFHSTFHVTDFADGHAVVSANEVGSFHFEPSDPAEPSASGRYRNGFTATFTQNTASETSVFNVAGKTNEGEQLRFQVRTHYTFANGELRVDDVTVRCG